VIRIVNQKYAFCSVDPKQSSWDMLIKLCRVCVTGSADVLVWAATNLAASDMTEDLTGPK
jgi:hypothetical protein